MRPIPPTAKGPKLSVPRYDLSSCRGRRLQHGLRPRLVKWGIRLPLKETVVALQSVRSVLFVSATKFLS
jgi:hypothetical protein